MLGNSWPADSFGKYKTRDIPNKVCIVVVHNFIFKLYISNRFDSSSAVSGALWYKNHKRHRFAATYYLQTCFNLLKQLEASIWIS